MRDRERNRASGPGPAKACPTAGPPAYVHVKLAKAMTISSIPAPLAPGALRAAPADRDGRDGGGVPRAPRRAARLPEDRRGQAHPAAVRARPGLRRDVRRRGARLRAPGPPEHRPGVRLRRAGRRALHGDGVRRRDDRRAPHPRGGVARRGRPPRRLPAHRALGPPRARVRARRARRRGQPAGPRAPRRVAGQRAHRPLGRGEAHRLRHRARGGDRAAHRRRAAQGQARVHVARAGRRPRARRAERPLHARHRPRRDAHPSPALQRREGARRPDAHPRRGRLGRSTAPRRACPTTCARVLFRALARDPMLRWPSAGAFAEAIEDIVRRRRLQVGPSRLAAFVEKLGLVAGPDVEEETRETGRRDRPARERHEHARGPARARSEPEPSRPSVPPSEPRAVSPSIYRVQREDGTIVGPMALAAPHRAVRHGRGREPTARSRASRGASSRRRRTPSSRAS